MKLLVLGANGMVGHMLCAYFRANTKYSVFSATRCEGDESSLYLDVRDTDGVERALELVRPDAVINCAGLLHEKAALQAAEAMEINGLLPHRLCRFLERTGGKLVQISTPHVFAGLRGGYAEDDLPDGDSAYAKTKAVGEVRSARHLTVRTSLLGPELRADGYGWFARLFGQSAAVCAGAHVIGNGITTLQLAKSLDDMLGRGMTGLYHLTAPEKISEYDLLLLVQRIFQLKDAEVVRDASSKLDYTLKNTRGNLRCAIPGYQQMLYELRSWIRACPFNPNIPSGARWVP